MLPPSIFRANESKRLAIIKASPKQSLVDRVIKLRMTAFLNVAIDTPFPVLRLLYFLVTKVLFPYDVQRLTRIWLFNEMHFSREIYEGTTIVSYNVEGGEVHVSPIVYYASAAIHAVLKEPGSDSLIKAMAELALRGED